MQLPINGDPNNPPRQPVIGLPASSIVTVKAFAVKDGTGSPLASGMLQFNTAYIPVRAGTVDAGNVGIQIRVPLRGDVVVTDTYGANVILLLPNVAVNNGTFDFDNYILPTGVTAQGVGVPRIKAQAGALYQQLDGGLQLWLYNGSTWGLSGQAQQSLPPASSTSSGYLTQADWNNFNGKSSLTLSTNTYYADTTVSQLASINNIVITNNLNLTIPNATDANTGTMINIFNVGAGNCVINSNGFGNSSVTASIPVSPNSAVMLVSVNSIWRIG